MRRIVLDSVVKNKLFLQYNLLINIKLSNINLIREDAGTKYPKIYADWFVDNKNSFSIRPEYPELGGSVNSTVRRGTQMSLVATATSLPDRKFQVAR